MNWRRLRAVARKETLHVLRDPRSLVMALALPLVMLVLFGWALTLDVDRIPLVVYDWDGSPESRRLISNFQGSRYFEIVDAVESYREIEQKIERRLCMAALVIGNDFASAVKQGRTASVQLIFDGSDSNTTSIGLGYARGIIGDYSAAVRQEIAGRRLGQIPETPVEYKPRVWYNAELESKNYIVPGLVAVILMIIAALLTSLTIAREWETGTMEQLLSTPVRPAELVLGKMTTYFGIGIVDALLAIVTGVWIFDVPLRGDVLLLAGTCCLFLFGALGWGILLSASVKSQLVAYQAGMLSSFLPAFLLSGFVFAIEVMPTPVQIATYLVPARYFITILKGIFLKDIGLSILAGEIAFLALFALLVFWAATRKIGGKVA